MECTNTQRSANQKKKKYNSETLKKNLLIMITLSKKP